MIIFFLDDNIERHDYAEKVLGRQHLLIHAYSYDDAIEYLKLNNQTIGLMMLDHDLGDLREEDGHKIDYNGSKFVDYLLLNIDKSNYPTRAIIHSSNYSGAENMKSKLHSAGIWTEVCSYSSSLIDRLATSLTVQ